MKNSIFKILVFLLVAPIILGAGQVKAIEYSGWGGKPANPDPENPRTESIFVINEKAGTVVEDAVLVVNNSQETKKLRVYGQDSVLSSDGAFACKQFVETKSEVGDWIALSSDYVTLSPGETKEVPFTVSIPQDAEPGEHNGCIVIQDEKTSTDDSTKEGVVLSFRTAMRVAVTVPGVITRNLEILDSNIESNKSNGRVIVVTIENTGNVSIDVELEVTVKHFLGLETKELKSKNPVLAKSEADVRFDIPLFWGGWYKATSKIMYDVNPAAIIGVNTSSDPVVKTVESPWIFVRPSQTALLIEIPLLIFLILLVAVVVRNCLLEKNVKETWVKYKVKSGDTLRKISTERKVSWKLIARINKIKAPYELKTGDTILVPKAN